MSNGGGFNQFDFGDYVARELRKRDERIERLSQRVMELEARAGAAGLDPKAINAEGQYSPREAGALLGWSRQTVYQKVRSGILPATILPESHRMLIPGRAILALIERAKPRGAAGAGEVAA